MSAPVPSAPALAPWWAPWLGRPFGEGPGELTCWGLVRSIYRARLGVELPAYGEISARDLVRIARAMEAGKDDGWIAPGLPAALDVVLMRSPAGGRAVCHVGVLTDPGAMLHVEAASATVRVPLGHWSISGRVLGFRRLAPQATQRRPA